MQLKIPRAHRRKYIARLERQTIANMARSPEGYDGVVTTHLAVTSTLTTLLTSSTTSKPRTWLIGNKAQNKALTNEELREWRTRALSILSRVPVTTDSKMTTKMLCAFQILYNMEIE